ncbi:MULTISPECIES: hypothetical protein [Halorussus]|uniref:hypothetical protein n=1 Tax=Halorussus TaxID=1070314 RepID=UPI000E217965|nr:MULTISPECIES: hypothetical protein [Halorussus]NHN58134.1 hypothetical protein [Halorussus sp. JP-T4]
MRSAAAAVVALLVVATLSTGALAGLDDGDGVSTVDELLGPTDPLRSDTDGDGLADGAELDRGTDPTVADTDGDGLDDGSEIDAGSDPTSVDTDGDGLDDGPEVHDYGTDPANPDTDADGLADRAEVVEYGTDPTESDTDGDGLSDSAEVNDQPTDPTDPDTDGDGLADGAELDRGADPTVADTDADGLDDGPEVHDHGTDPTDRDTDGDGLGDGVEVRAGAPLAAADPLRKDVFLELDYMRGTTAPTEKLKKVERAFANAPVENPDGSRGIDLHVGVADEPVAPAANTSLAEYSNGYYRSAFDTRGRGYFHALIVKEVPDRGGGNRVGITSTGVDGMIVEDRPSRVRVVKTLMHELGHNLGLHPGRHRGIDSYAVQPRRYPSVMNYHRLGGCDCNYDYSDGTNSPDDFDDWGYIASALAEETPNATAVRAQVE